MKMTSGRTALGIGLLMALTGCCSIIHGTRQDVGISSTPTGAMVKIDNVPSGNTPLVAKLTRKDNHVVHVELAGYQPVDMTLTRGVSGWVWGNLVFGGLIGLAVDAIDGAFYNLSPEQVSAALTANHASVTRTQDGIYLFAVMKPDPGWVKIGQLRPTE
jgi:PEGA domain